MAWSGDVTVGIDIGTSSVKAVVANGDGEVLRSARIAHDLSIPSPQRFEHDAARCWYDGPLAALAALGDDVNPVGVSVAAMVPSLTAVDSNERPFGAGLLYGDERGAGGSGLPGNSGELGRFLASLATEHPMAHGFRPAQAVANAALSGEATISTTAASPCWPLFDFHGWNETLVHGAGARVDQLPRLVPGGSVAGTLIGNDDCVVEGGTIDALAEQLVAGADHDGDVLVICGTTLIVWCVTSEPAEAAGYFPIPHTAPGKFLLGGPSNAGGLFLNWAASLLATDGGACDLANVPLWVPYPRGERVPLDDAERRAEIHGLDLTHKAASIRRAAFEAAGFVTRRMIEASPGTPRRIVATGGGVRVSEWLDTLATCTGLAVDVVATPEGGALGAAFMARIAAGLETSTQDAGRWARIERTVEPDTRWTTAIDDRYHRWTEFAS